MIKIKVFEDYKNKEYIIDISGHAGYAEKGKDIVCAGVSTLFYTFLNYCEEACEHNTLCKLEKAITDNKCVLQLRDEAMLEGQALRVIVKGFKMLAETYPEYVALSYINYYTGHKTSP